MSPLVLGCACASASALASGVARVILRARGIVDRPNARSSHVAPTVRGGGTAFVLVVLLAVAELALARADVATCAVLGAALVLAIVSFVDDVRGLGAGVRLSMHALSASVLAAQVAMHPPTDSIPVAAALVLIAFVGSVGYTNAFNFMDGIDGIASLQAVIGGFATAAVALVAGSSGDGLGVLLPVALGASVLGFLPWNFPRARMFMGDVGSATLGYLSAADLVRVVLEHGLSLVVPLALVHLGFVLDTAITLVRRYRRGERLTEAHREHFYQRLVRSGLGHPPVALLYAGGALLGAAIGFLCVGRGALVQALASIAVVGFWLAVFAYAERRFSRAR